MGKPNSAWLWKTTNQFIYFVLPVLLFNKISKKLETWPWSVTPSILSTATKPSWQPFSANAAPRIFHIVYTFISYGARAPLARVFRREPCPPRGRIGRQRGTAAAPHRRQAGGAALHHRRDRDRRLHRPLLWGRLGHPRRGAGHLVRAHCYHTRHCAMARGRRIEIASVLWSFATTISRFLVFISLYWDQRIVTATWLLCEAGLRCACVVEVLCHLGQW